MPRHDDEPPRPLRMGLRAKSILLFVLCAAVIVVLAWAIGARIVDAIKLHYGEAYVREHTLLYKQRILAPLNRELALAQRLADEAVISAFFRDEAAPGARDAAIREAEAYRKLMSGQLYSLVVAKTGNYYLNDGKLPFSAAPRYAVKADNPDDNWFFSLLQRPQPYQLNVSQDEHLKTTKVWLNVMVGEPRQRLGLISAGLDFTSFLQEYVRKPQEGVSAMVIDQQGAIMAHADPARIQFQVAGSTRIDQTLDRYLGSEADRATIRKAMAEARARPDQVRSVQVTLDGSTQLLALAYIPELHWYAVTALDWHTAQLISLDQFLPWLLAALCLLGLLFVLLTLGVDRGLLRPLAQFTGLAQRFGHGDYSVRITSTRQDELGVLANVFNRMAERVDQHASELEQKVADRTQALSDANALMAEAHQHIQESLRYASLIQRSLLPEDEFRQRLGDNGLLWLQPRDVVGGDLFVFSEDENGYLMGVIDCAGHGVPGAFMTMLAHVAADLALNEAGPSDPARLIALIDARVRGMLPADNARSKLATNMDAAFCYVNLSECTLTFAGAKLPLFLIRADGVETIDGGRRAIAELRQGEWENHTRLLDGVDAVCLATDGLFDLAGGEAGFGLGKKQFADWLPDLVRVSPAGRVALLTGLIRSWQGSYPQRDDMSVIGVTFPAQGPAAQPHFNKEQE